VSFQASRREWSSSLVDANASLAETATSSTFFRSFSTPALCHLQGIINLLRTALGIPFSILPEHPNEARSGHFPSKGLRQEGDLRKKEKSGDIEASHESARPEGPPTCTPRSANASTFTSWGCFISAQDAASGRPFGRDAKSARMSHPVLKAKPNALITCAPGSSYTHA
jgi:hypothetical protein